MVKALIFDFDGVLVMSEHARFRVLQTMAMKHGIEIKDDLFKKIVGRTTKDFFNEYFPTIDPRTLEKIIADYTAEYKDKIIDHTTPIAFTNDFIRNYSGEKILAVTSGSTTRIIEQLLSHLGLRNKISAVVGQEHVTKHKPHPEACMYTSEQLKIPAEECIVFEDSIAGAQAALDAGMQVYAILNGLNSKEDFNSLKISGYIKDYDDLVTVASV
jgi:HAD superfamily hydrolase (TIGR01509 family)